MKFDLKIIAALLLTAGISIASTAALTAPAQPQTRIEADQATGEVRFFAGGVEVGRFDKAGLHIRGNISYGGAITDVGDGRGGHAP